MRWSLNEIVVESSRVECELCSGDCRGDGTECKQQGKSSELCCGMTRNCESQHASRGSQDQLRCNLTLSQALTKHGFNALSSM